MDKKRTSVYIAEIKRKYKDKIYTTYLLRHCYREDGKVKQQTLANLSHLPTEGIAILRGVLRGEKYIPLEQAFEIEETRHHGHVAAVRTMLRRLGLHDIIDPEGSRMRDLVEAMIVARVVEPQPKLSTTRWWETTTLPDDLGVADATEDDLYAAMDWLLARQPVIERELGRRHLEEGGLVLYDLTSSYVEGTRCPLAAFSHNRDGKLGKRQVSYGLMTDSLGRPVAVEVFTGNTGDPKTVTAQVEKIKARFCLKHVALTGDRGMLTGARHAPSVGPRELKEAGGIDWLSALRSKEIQALASAGAIQPTLFDQRDLAEIASPDYPGERLIVCRNPVLAEERARKREELLQATERLLGNLEKRVEAGRLKRRQEAALDGIWVVRTSVSAERLPAEAAVAGYKSLSGAERAFRIFNHFTADRVRAHILLCMLAYYVEWHLREAWREFLFDDEDPGRHSFQTLMADLGTICRHRVRVPAQPHLPSFETVTTPTPFQQAVCERVGLNWTGKCSVR